MSHVPQGEKHIKWFLSICYHTPYSQVRAVQMGLADAIYEGTLEVILHLREGFKKKCEKVWSFAKPGGGSPGVVKKPNCFFETEFFSESI